jgi:CheY-like chemotaxis protein
MTIPAQDSAFRHARSGLAPLSPGRDATTAAPSGLEMMMLPAVFHCFRLPSLDGTRPSMMRNWHQTSRFSGRQHVVVMDNDPRLLEVLGNLLDDEGYDVTLSADLLDEDDLGRLRADIVLVDTSYSRAPGGTPLYPHPIALRNGSAVAVVYSTMRPAVASKFAAAGMTALVKPFDLDDLLELLAHVCH